MLNQFKRIEVLKSDKDEWLRALENLIKVLRDNSHTAQADWVRQIHGSLYQNDIKDFIKKLNSANTWGGSGAVWEVGVFKSREDEIEFAKQLINVVRLMRTDGISHSKARSVERLFIKEYALK